MLVKDYKDLQVWQKADDLAHEVYLLTRTFPREEQFNLSSQLNRASLSIPTNIVEGFYRTKKEFCHFIVIAVGSLRETEYLLGVALRRQYISNLQYADLMSTINPLSKMMSVFLKSITNQLVN